MTDTLIIWCNMLGAGVAAAVNAWCASVVASRTAPLRWTIAALASIYVAAYAVLLLVPSISGEWSRVMRGVSLVVWPLVWTWPAVAARNSVRRVVARLDDAAARSES